ncbi:hypothetical protein SRHO_G00133000 [Serrasalmus rhombeus]
MKNRQRRLCTLPWIGPPGFTSEARPGGSIPWRAPGGRAAHVTRLGSARRGNVGGPCGTTTRKVQHGGAVQCCTGSGRLQGGPWRTRPLRQKLALGTWNVTSLGVGEPELVREVESHSCGHRHWVAQGERRRAGLGILTSPRLVDVQLEFVPVDKRVASM